MIRIFRNLKSSLVNEGKPGRYLIYAFGEIILVVIGILIALQIDNMNDRHKQRELEVHYLQNIKVDLNLTVNSLDRYISERSTCIANANRILEHAEGRLITNTDSINAQCISIYSWRQFNQSNNTFQELVHSGNLALISNDSIKNMLLTLDSEYELLKHEEAHFRYDSEELLYGPLYRLVDLNPMIDNFAWNTSRGQAGKKSVLKVEVFEKLLQDVKVKNGFVMTKLEFGIMNGMMSELKSKSTQLIKIIDRELSK